jgi:GT2 family glycosyltransferase
MSTRSPRITPPAALAAALSVAAPVAVAAGAPSPVRLALVLAFFLLAPGTALLGALRGNGARTAAGPVVATGLALTVITGTAMIELDAFSPLTGLIALAGLSLLGLAVGARRGVVAETTVAEPIAMWVTELELSRPIPALLPPRREGQAPYPAARILVRAHSEPLGFVTVPITRDRVEPEAIVAAVHASLAAELEEHLLADDQPVQPLGLEGIPAPAVLACAAPEPEHAPRVSVVVCTRDREDSLRIALESVLETAYPDLELVVVDNAPKTSATRDVVHALNDPRVRYVLESRPGLSRARNAGVEAAQGDLIAFTDDDVVVDPLWIDGLVRGLGRAPHVGLVTGIVAPAELDTRPQLYFEAKVQWSAHCRAKLFDLDANRHDDHPLYPYSAGLFGTGANFAITRAAFEDIGRFDEALGAGAPAQGGEDLDYFLRALIGKWAIAYESSALVWHSHRRDEEALVKQMWGYGAGLSAYVAKHLCNPRVALDLLRMVPGGILRFARWNHGVSTEVPMPAVTQRTELRGLIAGPSSYRRGRRMLRAEAASR